MSNLSRRTLLTSLPLFFLPNLGESSLKEEQLHIKWEPFFHLGHRKEYYSRFKYKGHLIVATLRNNIVTMSSSIFLDFYFKDQYNKRTCVTKIGIETLDLEKLTLEVKKIVKACL